MGNRQTEQSAIEHVMALERAAGREPEDVHSTGLPYASPPRKIEVKAFSRSARSEALPLEDRQVNEAKADPDHYYVYVVDNLAGSDGAEVGVRMLHGDVLLAMIKRSKPQITYWPTFKAAEYDQAEQLL
ncbi:protein NO VEIN domain-containing protein [Streptomyces maoxianensis]|uniref:Protein NO VEIN domain-containing protein n=1 Tax=Streptomyces maoxianensis TaxID=1459942 RepID=A0ABV9G1G7_9ACTN